MKESGQPAGGGGVQEQNCRQTDKKGRMMELKKLGLRADWLGEHGQVKYWRQTNTNKRFWTR